MKTIHPQFDPELEHGHYAPPRFQIRTKLHGAPQRVDKNEKMWRSAQDQNRNSSWSAEAGFQLARRFLFLKAPES